MSHRASVKRAKARPGWRGLAPALKSPNFRLFWLAQTVSTSGTALQVVAEGWLIYQITGSTLWLGLVGLFALMPVVPIAFYGGILIDRVPRRKLIILTQAGLLLQALLFAYVAGRPDLTPWHITGMVFIFGALLAIDHPARRAFLVDLVAPKDLANAVALNASLFNLSHLIGFSVAGFLLVTIGASGTMLVNGASYIIPIVALTFIKVQEGAVDEKRPSLTSAASEGIVTLWQKPTLLAVIGLMALVGGLAWPVFGLMPAFAESVLGSNGIGLGILLAAGALGSLLGTAVVAQTGEKRRGRLLLSAAFCLPLAVIAFALTKQIWLAFLAVMLVGMLLIVVQSIAITLVQVHIENRVRGRVMSLYSMIHAGADTLSNVLVGAAAVALTLPWALALGGGLALVFTAVVFRTVPTIRQLE